jgi:hypothetical protein
VPTAAVQKLGVADAARLALLAGVDRFRGFNTLVDGLRVEQDDKPWYG